MAPHLVRTLGAYRDLQMYTFYHIHTQTQEHTCIHKCTHVCILPLPPVDWM